MLCQGADGPGSTRSSSTVSIRDRIDKIAVDYINPVRTNGINIDRSDRVAANPLMQGLAATPSLRSTSIPSILTGSILSTATLSIPSWIDTVDGDLVDPGPSAP
ncbi:hypothetical protein GGR55DRAFT_680909 [Xylaria sp. FL0064]|nr:hypothetical protein GGR55DRAFT_680909 [Xylaria sp. FL0064]